MLGITSPADENGSRLRSLQYASLGEAGFIRLATQALAALSVAFFLFHRVHIPLLLIWAAAIAASLWCVRKVERTLIDADRRRITGREVRRHILAHTCNAAIWAIPLGLFAGFTDPQTTMKLWTVLAIMEVASAMLMPSIPLATIVFALIAGGSAVLRFGLLGMADIAFVATLYSLVVIVAATEAARRDLVTKVIEVGLAEKDQVVSMLLREHQEGDADWLWQTDAQRRVRAVSPRFAFALGRDAAEANNMPLLQLISGSAWENGDFPSSLLDLAERLKRRENFSNLLVRVTVAGQPHWWEISGSPKFTDEGLFDGFRGVGSDVTEARENSDKIAWLARYDTLTGLPNRTMLTEALGEALEYAAKWRTRCAFLMIDLDRFKSVNDSLGHHIGDQLLARVSDRLKEQLSDNELCGRLGGDEFAIVIRDASAPDIVQQIARRVIQRLSQPYEVEHHTLYVGASVGSAVGPRDGSTVEMLMRNADLALYRSKDSGGNTHCCYEPALHAHAEQRRQLEFSLRHALDANEFALNFQPVVDTQNESLVSFEALLRWNSKDHGEVSPAKFIPLAEDTRLIVPIGEWVLREACKEAKKWPSHVHVAVNVSGEQLLDNDFAASVVTALSESALQPQRLELEVTESIFLRDGDQARASLEQVMALGCRIALDDFGTGYSALGYLRKLRFSTIKIDRSFVQGAAGGNIESLAIIRAVIAMAESLDMATTAEGVETERELELLRALGCRKIQGYYFGRPMTAKDAELLFRSRSYLDRQDVA